MQGNQLEAERVRAGLSVPAFCEALGISRTSYYRKRTGATDWTLGEMMAAAKACRMNRDTVFNVFFADEVSEKTPQEA